MTNGFKTPGGGSHSQKQPQSQGHGWGGGGQNKPPEASRFTEAWLKENINFENLDPNLFSAVAQDAAEKVNEGKANKRTQLRRFYDELTMWSDRVEQVKREDQPGKYQEWAPFIKMLKAKVVYAQGRGHVDKTFTALFSRCLDEIKDPKTLRHAKLFLEAFMGFYRQYDSQ